MQGMAVSTYEPVIGVVELRIDGVDVVINKGE
jgi:hypothetical protein